MHQLLRIGLWAESDDEAQAQLQQLLDGPDGQLTRPEGYFDYGFSLSNLRARWRESYPEFAEMGVVPFAEEAGWRAFEDGWELQREEFVRNLQALRVAIAELDEEAFYNNEPVDIEFRKGDLPSLGLPLPDDYDPDEMTTVEERPRWVCDSIGQYEGSSIYVYDGDGVAIRTHDDLTRLLEGRYYEDDELYVGLADVHY